MTDIFGRNRLRRLCFGLFVFSSIVCTIATRFHYTHKYPGNSLTWVAWVGSLVFFIATYLPDPATLAKRAAGSWSRNRRFVCFIGSLALLFAITHIWNFKTAPWNWNGLFDDAAWDIYFAKKYVFTSEPFQAAFPDGIAREIAFHYYITFFFLLFGYNLLTFNIALLLLGMATFLFTCLIIHELFGSYPVTAVSALIFNFLPFHFIQTFIGHRYAMAAPLITGSFYFLMTAYCRRSLFRAGIGGILAALCVESAIMGKQYLMCLFAAMIASIIVSYKRTVTKDNASLAVVFVLGLLVALVPMIMFVYYNSRLYFAHERELTELFLQAYKNRATGAFKPYVDDLTGIFFSSFHGKRLAMQNYVLIPFFYYALLIPGLVIALFRKHFGIVLLAIVPVAGAFVSSAYDFRVLHAAPFWIVLMSFSLWGLTRVRLWPFFRRPLVTAVLLIGVAGIVAGGLIPSVRYLYGRSIDPFSVHILGQHDVVISRFLRDVVAGVPRPSGKRKHNEFKKLPIQDSPYDALACVESGFAITHLFLQDYGDRQILSFCEQAPMMNITPVNLFGMNKRAVMSYNGAKGLMLVWQSGGKATSAIEDFKKLGRLGSDQVLRVQHAGRSYYFYVFTVPKENIAQFKEELAGLNF